MTLWSASRGQPHILQTAIAAIRFSRLWAPLILSRPSSKVSLVPFSPWKRIPSGVKKEPNETARRALKRSTWVSRRRASAKGGRPR